MMFYCYSLAQQPTITSCGHDDPAFQQILAQDEVDAAANNSNSLPALPICDDPSVIKYLRVNVHFMLEDDGTGNFTETDDGQGNPYSGYQRAVDIIDSINYELDNNQHQVVKDPNSYYPPTPPENIVRLVLMGVYFHRDSDVKNSPQNSFEHHYNYAVNEDSEVNIFMVANLSRSGGGIARYSINSTQVNNYHQYLNTPVWSIWAATHLVMHEVGHLLVGAGHTWKQFDGCDDTPEHGFYDASGLKQCCWDYNSPVNEPYCDVWAHASKNFMDYVARHPHNFTLCQIDLMNTKMQGGLNPYIHSCNHCLPSNAFFDIKAKCENSNLTVPLNGIASFNEDKYLITICEVSGYSDQTCDGNYYSTGWNSGEVGIKQLNWWYYFNPLTHYKVTLSVDNTECSGSSEMTKIIKTPKLCTQGGIFGYRVGSNITFGTAEVEYDLLKDGRVTIIATNLSHFGAGGKVVYEGNAEMGKHKRNIDLSSYPIGTYAISILFEGELLSKTVVKL